MVDKKNFGRRIEEVLSKHFEGLSITEISGLVGCHRLTVAKYIDELVKTGVIYQRNLKTIKLHYLSSELSEKERALLERLEKKIGH
jgi:DNA-binding IclR family transcriptional regulator